jgi:thiamine phosphate synthase YjbQ (UPF0047 family)
MAVTETIDVRTTTRAETIDITSLVRAAVKKSGIDSGIAVVFCKHTTAGLTIQENSDPTVRAALLAHLTGRHRRDHQRQRRRQVDRPVEGEHALDDPGQADEHHQAADQRQLRADQEAGPAKGPAGVRSRHRDILVGPAGGRDFRPAGR